MQLNLSAMPPEPLKVTII